MSAVQRLRCAVYTRKSSEEGLDQEFNSLDAQREACSAYIASQVGLGWKLVIDRYDDGGISGGTMERPALKRLLADISAKKVDVVVVYKIDRLTRSLTDFARIVEVFDGNGVSFVSVTQQFNTTTSMGRLTLNVLLSFAQFEREVTTERIRDKIAASKKRGIWMGGTVPLGYQVVSRKLLIKEPEAAFVRRLFSRYLELRSVPALTAEVARQVDALQQSDSRATEHTPPQYVRRVGSGMLYKLLSNPIYIGKLRHRDKVYDGEHPAIITTDQFAEVQSTLTSQASMPRASTSHADVHLLTGILFDDTGDRLSPTHAKARGKRYRYYISSRIKGAKRTDNTVWRIPANQLDSTVIRFATKLLSDRSRLVDWIRTYAPPADIQRCLGQAEVLRAKLLNDTTANQRTMLLTVFRSITLGDDAVTFDVDAAAVIMLLQGLGLASAISTIEDDADDDNRRNQVVSIELPISVNRRGYEMRLVIHPDYLPRIADQSLVELIAKAHIYLDSLTRAPGISVSDVANEFGVHRVDVGRILPLAFLAPNITDQILTGNQPESLTARKLARANLPYAWVDQSSALG